jgi:3-phosphoshikimate 1-carboxyvinyltransferase
MPNLALSPFQPTKTFLEIPSCLSYTIRALFVAAQIPETVTILNPLQCDDVDATVGILNELGITTENLGDKILVKGSTADVDPTKSYNCFVNLSGRTARFALPFLCIVGGTKVLTGAEPFLKRPMGEQVWGLQQLGAKIEYLGNEGCLPVRINSSSLNSGVSKMRGELSAQFFAGIMAIAPSVGEIILEVEGEQASKPFIDMTVDVMAHFGVKVINDNYQKYTINGGQKYIAKDYTVETDAMSATYFWGTAILTGQSLTIPALPKHSAQGDVRFPNILEQMGCPISYNNDDSITVSAPINCLLKGITVDMSAHPDTAVTIMVLGAMAQGITKITNIAHLRAKESDRLNSPAAELRKLGINVEVGDDFIEIEGIGGNISKLTPTAIDTYHDHRMAMSFAMIGAICDGITINDAQVVSKSFPNFWEKWVEFGGSVKEA